MEEERRVVCRPTVLGLFSKVAGMEDGEILNTQCYHYAIISTIIEIMRQLSIHHWDVAGYFNGDLHYCLTPSTPQPWYKGSIGGGKVIICLDHLLIKFSFPLASW